MREGLQEQCSLSANKWNLTCRALGVLSLMFQKVKRLYSILDPKCRTFLEPCASRPTGDFYFGAIGEFSSGTDTIPKRDRCQRRAEARWSRWWPGANVRRARRRACLGRWRHPNGGRHSRRPTADRAPGPEGDHGCDGGAGRAERPDPCRARPRRATPRSGGARAASPG